MRAPRRRLSSRSLAVVISAPSKRMLPRMRAAAGDRPGIASASWLLPAPDSPTRPRLAPRPSASDRSSMAVSSPAGVAKLTVSPSSSSSDSARMWILRVAQCIAERAEREHDRDQAQARREQHPRRALHFGRALGDEIAEACGGLGNAESEE